MVNDSKILTVSYGTFSCTLEGFDDPFSTMRGIAEYFRDLAADDRYFGAEPPTPDANMLHSIAEKEIQRRVEAQVQGNGIVLRQMDDGTQNPLAAVAQPAHDAKSDDASASQKSAPKKSTGKKKKTKKAGKPRNTRALQRKAAAKTDRAKTAPKETFENGAAYFENGAAYNADAVDQTPATIVADAAPFVAPLETESALANVAPTASGSIADKLERIRAAVAQRNTSDVDYAEDQHATDEQVSIQALLNTDDNAHPDTTHAAPVADMQAQDQAEDDATSQDDQQLAAQAKASKNRMAAKAARKKRLKAAAAARAKAAQEAEEQENTADESFVQDSETIDLIASHTDAVKDGSGDTDTKASNAKSELHEMDLSLVEDIAKATRSEPTEAADQPDPDRRVRARVVKMRRTDTMPTQADSVTDTQDSEEEAFDPTRFADKLSAADPDVPAQPEAEIDEVEEDADLTALLRKELGDSSLDDEAEDELMRELAEVALDSDGPKDVAADIISDEGEDTAPQASDAAYAKPENDFRLADTAQDDDFDDDETRNVFDESDKSVSRLLDTAEREMENGENTRRRNAIQHLKAAVAATRAEKSDASAAQKDEDQDAEQYREDLARVVRPTRPSEKTSSGERPLAPLMLVSEQRIDAPKGIVPGANISPVRPRRVSSAALAVKEDQEEDFDIQNLLQDAAPVRNLNTKDAASFADYVETVGADGLSDLLEAAAAYSNFVQGRETVSRPQIMRLASEAMPEELPLEERLRSFGQLLRQGKIRKIKRGQFVVADGTRFKPEAEAS